MGNWAARMAASTNQGPCATDRSNKGLAGPSLRLLLVFRGGELRLPDFSRLSCRFKVYVDHELYVK